MSRGTKEWLDSEGLPNEFHPHYRDFMLATLIRETVKPRFLAESVVITVLGVKNWYKEQKYRNQHRNYHIFDFSTSK